MSRALAIEVIAMVLATTIGAASEAPARDIDVPPGDGLARAIAQATPGDVLHLQPGIHRAGISIGVPRLTIEGKPGAIADGAGEASVITIKAPDVTVRKLTIRNSGLSLPDKNSGVFVDRGGDRALIERNHFDQNLVGVYLDGPKDVIVRQNRIDGLTRLRRNERGPGIELFDTPGSKIEDNEIADGRDGVFSVNSRENEIRGNSFSRLRYAVHFMYTNGSQVTDNRSIGNDIGYAIMYSDRESIVGNVSDHDREHGLLMNYANASLVQGNAIRGAEKCVFVYNANKNRIEGNWFEGCAIGIHFTAGSERNEITGNAFVGNRRQVMYVGTRLLDWSVNGRGNYYSDNPAFDVNGDGIADTPYRPNDIVDQVVWRAPAAKILLNSPAVQVVRWAQAQFPAIHPGGVIDTAPLMKPRRPSALERMTP